MENENTEVKATETETKTGTFTQDDVDRIVKERIAREHEKYSSVQSELENLKMAEEKRKLEEMSELERIQAEKETLAKTLEEQQGKLRTMEISRMRDTVIMGDANASNLPGAYKRMVAGDTEDEVKASLAAVIEEYKNDMRGVAPQPRIGVVTRAADGGEPDESELEMSPYEKIMKRVKDPRRSD